MICETKYEMSYKKIDVKNGLLILLIFTLFYIAVR